jgi:hypothetical protein
LFDNRSEVEKETKLTVQHLETQAMHVVEQLKRRPKIRVPQHVLSMLRSAINARSRVAKWFETSVTSPDGTILQQDMSHQHFIDTLKKILLVLEPYVSPDAKTNSPPVTPPNRYELLEPEETLDKASKISNVVAVGDSLPDVKPELSAELQYQQDVSVHYFQVLCILEDIHSISKHVEEVWLEQKRRNVDSVVASVITEMAFQVFQEFEQYWPPMIPSDQPRRPVQDAHWFWLMTCDHNGQPQEYTKSHPLKEKAYMTGVSSIPIF